MNKFVAVRQYLQDGIPDSFMSGSTIKFKATLSQRVALFFLSPLFPWLAALFAASLVITTIDVADDLHWSLQGPGLTFDEGFNIEVGVFLARSFQLAGTSSFHPETLQEIYSNPLYNPDHPPLGRIAIGVTSEALNHFLPVETGQPYLVSYARVASAIEFGLLVLIISLASRRWFGPVASCATTISLICMPRLFGHAHLASLEMCMCLTYTAFFLSLANRCKWDDRIGLRQVLVPGFLLGLALLTKIHAVLILPVVLVWFLWNWGLRSLIAFVFLCVVGGVVFFVGWPWLWSDPLNHLNEYFSRATERSSLNCFYFGKKFADTDVPWHYPFIMFLVTMPLGFLGTAVIGMTNRTDDENSKHALRDKRSQLIFGAWLLPLIVFALPKVTVYDGVRLFLISFPLFAIFVGLGAKRIVHRLQMKSGEFTIVTLTVLGLAGPIYNMITLHPCHLSYYNEAVAGLWKANDLGFETTYWGDSATPELLQAAAEKLPEGAVLEVAPVLHPLQLEFMRRGSWLRNRPDIVLKAYDDARSDLSPYVLVIRRKADPWESLTPPPEGTEQFAEVTKQGVVLAEVLKLPANAATRQPAE
ncbi:ArnT family glycosyltransferase [Thalassoglobus sp.]|uniref:ArnT family glycosyltransferase n=1 Tax=Thalassoglobus sp. TaxID=2795869 RepID=UPI003AA94704